MSFTTASGNVAYDRGQSGNIVHLSDGTEVWIDDDGTHRYLKYSSDRSTVNTIATLTNTIWQAGANLPTTWVVVDNLDNLYVVGPSSGSNSGDYVFQVQAFTKGSGYTWTAQTRNVYNPGSSYTNSAASGQVINIGSALWCNTGGGTGSKGHVVVHYTGFNGSSNYVQAAMVFDAGAALAGTLTVTYHGQPTHLGGTGSSGPYNKGPRAAASSFGATSGMSLCAQNTTTTSWGVVMGSWTVGSAGTFTASSVVSNAAYSVASNSWQYTYDLVSNNAGSYCATWTHPTNTTHQAVSLWNSGGVAVAPVDTGTPTNWPLTTASAYGGDGGLAYESVGNKWWLYARSVSGVTASIYRLGITPGGTVDSSATLVGSHSVASGGAFDSLRVSRQPRGGSLSIDVQLSERWTGGSDTYQVSESFYTPPGAPGAITAPASGATVNTTATLTWGASSAGSIPQASLQYQVDLSTDNGVTWSTIISLTSAGVTSTTYDFTAKPATSAAKLRVRAYDGISYTAFTTQAATFNIVHNQAPTAPTPLSPIGNAVLDLTSSQVFSWQFNDPDAGDTQSAYQLQYRLVGAGSWTQTGWVTSTTPSRSFAANFFAAGSYEWQVQTKDSQGVASPFSASAYFQAATPPPAPTITSPTNGGTVPTSSGTVNWSAPSQDAYEVRKLADNAGNPDTGTVYYDSGTVTSSTARNAPLDFPVNNRWEHLQVRIQVNTLWSTWASVRVNVSYTPPPTPTATMTPDSPQGAVTVAINNPAPTGTQPVVTSNNVYRRLVGDTSSGVRLATLVSPNGSWVSWTVASGKAYEFRIEAVGANNTSTFGAWTS